MTAREEIAELRADVEALQRVASLFYEAGRADALGIPPRVVNPAGKSSPPRGQLLPPGSTIRHLSVVRP